VSFRGSGGFNEESDDDEDDGRQMHNSDDEEDQAALPPPPQAAPAAASGGLFGKPAGAPTVSFSSLQPPNSRPGLLYICESLTYG